MTWHKTEEYKNCSVRCSWNIVMVMVDWHHGDHLIRSCRSKHIQVCYREPLQLDAYFGINEETIFRPLKEGLRWNPYTCNGLLRRRVCLNTLYSVRRKWRVFERLCSVCVVYRHRESVMGYKVLQIFRATVFEAIKTRYIIVVESRSKHRGRLFLLFSLEKETQMRTIPDIMCLSDSNTFDCTDGDIFWYFRHFSDLCKKKRTVAILCI